MRSTRLHHATARKYQSDGLAELVREALVHGGATSGVEQAFSKCGWALSDQQHGAGSRTKCDIRRIVLDSGNDKSQVLRHAQEEWAKHYGIARRPSNRERVHVGVPQPRSGSATEVAFVRKRRLGVQHIVKKRFRTGQGDIGKGDFWSQKHEKEKDFNDDKLQKKKLEAYLNNQLAEEDIDESLKRKVKEYKEDRDKLDKQRTREADVRVARAEGGRLCAPAELRGQSAYVQSDLQSEQLMAILACSGLRHVDLRLHATVFIVASPGNPGERVLWRATLVGAYVASPATFIQRKGPAIKYEAAILKRRQLWVSAGYKARHSAAAAIILDTIRTFPGSKWRLIAGGIDNFRTEVARARRAGRRAEVLALVTDGEQDRSAQSLSQFLI